MVGVIDCEMLSVAELVLVHVLVEVIGQVAMTAGLMGVGGGGVDEDSSALSELNRAMKGAWSGVLSE